MIVSAPMIIIITLVTLSVTLAVFQGALADIAKKEEEIKKIEKISETISSIVLVSGKPSVNVQGCTADTQYTIFNYEFRISDLEAFFQGLPGSKDSMQVFTTLSFRSTVVRDSDRRLFTLKPGIAEPFGELAFQVRSGEAPYILKPEDPAFLGTIGVKQPVVVNNYRITPFRQFQSLGIPLTTCYTDFLVDCKDESQRLSLTSEKEDKSNYRNSVFVCGGRIEITLQKYDSAACGSRRMELVINTPAEGEKLPGWEYADSASIEFWKKEAAEPKESPCWQQGFTEGCRDKFLGAYLFNLSAESYNVQGCLFAGGGGIGGAGASGTF